MRQGKTDAGIFRARDVDEPVDYWLHRPIAGVVVGVLRRTPISPNQVTILSGLFGIAAGVCTAIADAASLWLVALGGGFIFASVIFDCCDGRLAQLRGEASLAGRALDGGIDGVVVISIFVGFVVFLLKLGHDPLYVIPVAGAAGYSWLRQTEGYDFAKQLFIANTSEAPLRNSLPTLEEIDAERARVLAQGQRAMAVFVSGFRAYTVVQRKRRRGEVSGLERAPMDTHELRLRYRELFGGYMRMWTWNGQGSHQFLMYAAAFLSLAWPPSALVAWLIMIVPLNVLAVLTQIWGTRLETRLSTERG